MAHNTEKLRELLERVEAASGPDREIDFDLISTFDEGSYAAREIESFRRWEGEKMISEGGPHYWGISYWRENFSSSCPIIKLTASLDASIALVERMLPGHGWSVNDYSGVKSGVGCFIHSPARCFHETGKTAPLAVLATLLSALISQAEGEGA